MPHMKRISFLCFLFLSLTAYAAKKPNVVFIFVDDQGYYDLSCYGASEVKTPRIDQLATEGIRFTDYYSAAPICSPSRAGLLTGCYPTRIGMQTWVQRADSNRGIHPDELTLGELFKANGYATASIGKWHIGHHEPFLPHSIGFDHHFGLIHNLDDVETIYFKDEGGTPLMRNGKVIKRPADPNELTRLYTDEAIQFIDKHSDEPFFLFLPHTMLHNPLGVSPEFRGSSNFGEYGDAIQELDHHTGRLMDHLKAKGLSENTVVIYASDNGRGPGRNKNQPIQGRKLSTYEGGIRVPCIAWGPGLGIQSGVTQKNIVTAMDWFPTLASLTGIRVPEDRVIDGRDLSVMLTKKSDEIPSFDKGTSLNSDVPNRRTWREAGEWSPLFSRREYQNAFFYHGSHGALAAVRSEKWKMYLNPTLKLYDLENDLSEQIPLRGHGDIRRKLRGMAVLFMEEMERDSRPSGEFIPPPLDEMKRTVIPKSLQDQLDAHMGVTYARYGERKLKLDIYRPKSAKGDLPAIVCIHGGGWAKGDRRNHAHVAQYIASQGYVAATISYRLSGESPFPAQIQDCKAAVRFLRANAKEYGLQADKIGAIGHSAGGHLTALLATSGDVESLEGNGGNPGVSSSIQAAVPSGAQTEFESERTRSISAEPNRGRIWRAFLTGSLEESPNVYRLASPIHHLDAGDPPTFFTTGEFDDPSTRANNFRAKMRSLKIPTGLKVINNAPHPFLPKQHFFNQAMDRSIEFFDKHLK